MAENKLPTVVQAAKGLALLEGYSEGKLHYDLAWVDEVFADFNHFKFVVPLDDPAAGGFFASSMKGLALLRWIRKELTRLEEEQAMIEEARKNWDPEVGL